MTGPRRAWIKLDRYALSDLAREHDLSPSELWVLYSLTVLADFRTGTWVGQIQDLQSYAMVSRDTLRKARTHLEDLKIIAEVEPFHGGDGHLGSILVLAYPDLVADCVPSVAERIDQYLSGNGRALDDDRKSIGRALDDDWTRKSPNDQGKGASARERGSEGVGGYSLEDNDRLCPTNCKAFVEHDYSPF